MKVDAALRIERKLQREVKARKRTFLTYVAGAVALALFVTLSILGIVLTHGMVDNALMALSVFGLLFTIPVGGGTLVYQWRENAPYLMYERAKYELEDFMLEEYSDAFL